SKQGQNAREKADSCNINCWMVCTASASIKKNIPKAMVWITKSQAKVALGKPLLK
ncbi:MAG: radical SAM protein, partial [Candidatus Diapherotrites archaeon]|nr:radical SAM protein [Candidatus Diapherotrites archaeon]